MKRKLRVAVLFGGRSGEHLISSLSARSVVAAMDPEKYQVVPIGIGLNGTWLLPDISRKVLEGGPLEVPESAFEADGEPITMIPDPSRRELVPLDPTGPVATIGEVDVVFPVLHGPYGEDGTVQGLLELADIPYVGAGVLGSSVGMDKEKMKTLLRAEGLPIANFLAIREASWASDRSAVLEQASQFGPVCFTKPSNLGSSVGIRRCTGLAELEQGIDFAFQYDRKVLVEEAIQGRELECSVLGNDFPEASVVGEIISGRDFYDYEAKYFDDASSAVVPADIPEAVSTLVRRYALRAFNAIDSAGLARVDFFYEEGGRGVIVNEINTMPGFTKISMYPKLWEASGISYPELIDRLIELAIERHGKKKRPEDQPSPLPKGR